MRDSIKQIRRLRNFLSTKDAIVINTDTDANPLNDFLYKLSIEDFITALNLTPPPSSGENIYNANGTLTGNRVVQLSDKTLQFASTTNGSFQVAVTNTSTNKAAQIYALTAGSAIEANFGSVLSTVRVFPEFASLLYSTGANNANIAISETGIMLADTLANKGLVGNDYYGANYTDNTYVQKKYVDDLISSSVSNIYTNDGVILNTNRTVNLDNSTLIFYGIGSSPENLTVAINSNLFAANINSSSGAISSLNVNLDGLNYYINTGVSGYLKFECNSENGLLVADSIFLKGLTGESDYSANTTSLSYIQKSYVDNTFLPISGGIITGSLTINAGSGTNVSIENNNITLTNDLTLESVQILNNGIAVNGESGITGDFLLQTQTAEFVGTLRFVNGICTSYTPA